MFWAERFGRELGLEDLWVKQCGNSHTGSFKDLGMTVLVSVVKQMIAHGGGVRAVACASTGDTSAALAAYARPPASPRSSSCRAARSPPRSSCSRSPTARCVLVARHRLRRLHGDRPAARRGRGLYLANSMNSLRLEGQKTLSVEIVQQFDWEVPDVVIVPGGNLGNVSAIGAGFDMMLDLGLIAKRPRLVVAQAEAANPLYRAYHATAGNSSRSTARPTIASAIQIGNPGLDRQGDPHAAALRRHRRAGDRERAGGRGGAGGSDRDVQLPAHRRRARGPREAARARRDPRDGSRRS